MINRLDEDTTPVDEILEGDTEMHKDTDFEDGDLKEFAGEAERVLGVPTERYVDEMKWEEKPGDVIATASEEIVYIDNRIDRSENELAFDPSFRDMGETHPEGNVSQPQMNGILHESLHAAYNNDDRARLLRDIGFSQQQVYEIENYAERGEDEMEAVTEFTARIINPLRDQVILNEREQSGTMNAYEGEVRELVRYLNNIDRMPEPERVMAIKNDDSFGSELEVEHTDVGMDHYIETGTYKDEEGREQNYAVIIGDNEETETFKDYMNENLYDDIIEADMDYMIDEENDDSDDGPDDDGPDYLDPLDNYDFEEENEEYSLNQGPTAELYAPEVVVGGEMTESAPQKPSVESDPAEYQQPAV